MLSTGQIAERTARAVTAATAAGRELGIRTDDPRVLYDVFSVIVHLAPAPVVVRVPTVVLPSYKANPDSQIAQQRAELAVAGWLADRGHPVVAPSPLVPREPVRRNGFSMTFWQFVDEVPGAVSDLEKRCAATATLHAALRDYDGANLGFWTPFNTYIPDGLAALESLPDLLDATDLERAQQEWAAIGPILATRQAFEATFPDARVQTIHGDAPFHNMITTRDGEMWSDFELVTLGPAESDIAPAGPDGVAAYDDAAARLGLRRLDERVLRVTEAAAQLAVVACLAMAPELPMLVDGVKPVVDQWRRSASSSPD